MEKHNIMLVFHILAMLTYKSLLYHQWLGLYTGYYKTRALLNMVKQKLLQNC